MENSKMTFKECARQARHRLISGYWEGVREDKARFLEAHYHRGDNMTSLKSMFRKKIERDLYGNNDMSEEDEKFYKKITKMLSENEYVLNPIKKLIDHEVYDKLDERGKQNYIFELTDKYNKFKEKYEKEHQSSMVVNS